MTPRSIWRFALFALAPLACGGTTAGVDLQGADVDGGADATHADGSQTGGDGGGADGGGGSDGGGADGGGGSDGGAGACTGGPTASFLLLAKGAFCTGHQCDASWLTILAPNGTPLTRGYLCATDCATCITRPCPPGLCAIPQPVPPGGATDVWDGTYFTNETRTCNGASTACYQARCAAPGRYTARMCAWARLDDAGLSCSQEASSPTCVDVPFDWPPTATISGSIGP